VFLGVARIVLALVTAAAVGVQFAHGLQSPTFRPTNFFSFFTIQSNVFCAIILLIAGSYALRKRPSDELALLRGASTLYMLITGIVYAALLSGSEAALQTTIPWVNLVVHYVIPLWMLFDWLIDTPALWLNYSAILARWLVYPLGYVFYSLARGAVVGWYPYPFLNARLHGYPFVCAMIVAIAVFSLALGSALVWIAGRPRIRRGHS